MERYDVFCDRPFLTSLIGDGRVSLIDEHVMFTRDHGENDSRFKDITEKDAFNLMSFYRESLPQPTSRADRRMLFVFSTNILLRTYPKVMDKKMSFLRFIRHGRALGLIDLRYVNKVGIVGIIEAFFGERVTNNLIRLYR